MWNDFASFWYKVTPYKNDTNIENSEGLKDNNIQENLEDVETAEYFAQIAQKAREKAMQDFKHEIFRNIRHASCSGINYSSLICPIGLDSNCIKSVKEELEEKGFNVSIKDGWSGQQILKTEW